MGEGMAPVAERQDFGVLVNLAGVVFLDALVAHLHERGFDGFTMRTGWVIRSVGDEPVSLRDLAARMNLSSPGALKAIDRATAEVSAEQRQLAEQLLSAVGIAVCVDSEALIDAVTAVSGSGPAYFFLLIEAMTDAGVKLGLPREVAKQLAEQTALGAAHMAVSSDVDAAELRRRVTSPAGTTEAAIKSFQADGFAASVEKALSAAAHRSAEMAEQLGQ